MTFPSSPTPPTSLALYGFSFNGFNFGGAGSVYQVMSVDGVESAPNLRVQDDNQGYNDGMFSGTDFYSERTITLVLNIFGDVSNTAQANYHTLRASINPQQTGTSYLQFKASLDADMQWVNARVRKITTPITPDYTYGLITTVLELFCPDPRIYSGVPFTPNTASITVGGSATVTNTGDVTTYPILTVTAASAVSNLVISNSTLGLSLTMKYGLSTSDVLILNTLTRTITLNGVNARNILSSSSVWFGAQSGANTFAVTGTGTATTSVSWYSAII